jgi:hypothetical protein
MRTIHKKASNKIWGANKFGHSPLKVDSIRGIFKLSRALQNSTAKSDRLGGFTRREEIEALALETQAKRDQGRIYAGLMPMR